LTVVLGYHGCDKETAQNLLGGSSFTFSKKPYDWLGGGAYFWEWDLVRAYEWAQKHKKESASVIGAAIDLGNCLDLTTRTGAQAIERAYQSYVIHQERQGLSLLANEDGKGNPGDLSLRYLDRAVITHLHEAMKEARLAEYDTVRALFPEGKELYPGAGFLKETHVQLAVRKNEQIRGVFRIPDHELSLFSIPGDIYDFKRS